MPAYWSTTQKEGQDKAKVWGEASSKFGDSTPRGNGQDKGMNMKHYGRKQETTRNQRQSEGSNILKIEQGE
jgi:hypothetical protein